ncbi:MAG: TonB-dependent receptor [Siphonobacter sp.]
MPRQRPRQPHFYTVLLSFVLLLTVVSNAFAQGRKLSGKVSDEKGQGVPGVNIILKGTQRGTVSNSDGTYQLTIPDGPGTLVASSIGYKTQEIDITSQTELNITLIGEDKSLNEVVVVGYGTQKKVNMTGSVASISAANIENRPVTNLSSSLAGLAAGVSVQQGSGKPGSDGATIRIRGNGSLNNNNPLVVVDGIISSMDAVNPNDVESMSILKDAASASIYGSLAANGVILITTKKGNKNKVTVSYTGMMSMSQPMNTIKFVTNYARHMNLVNEGFRNLGQSNLFAQSTIDAWTAAEKDPNGVSTNGVPNWLAYPNTDWAKTIFENNILQNHNISVSGGSEKSSYLLSANYLGNPGTMANTGTKRYIIRANLDSKVTKFLTVGTQTYASIQSYGMANTDNAFNYLRQTTPGLVPYYDGKYGFAQAPEESSTANNILTYLYGTGGDSKQSRFNTTLYATLNLVKGLSFESRFNYQTRFAEANSHTNPFIRWDFLSNTLKSAASTPDQLSTSYSFNKDFATTVDLVLRYNNQIGDHSFGAIAGFNQYYYDYYNTSATKMGLVDYDITTLSSATTMTSTTGSEYDYAQKSFFGRLNYNFKDRYLLEANMRYDGSSKFAPSNRWGIFPSFSAGWRISEEPFMAGINNHIQNLKIRGSWGKLGNNVMNTDASQGNYDYQSLYNTNTYSYNGVAATGLWQGKIANSNLKWESTTVTDLGIEGSVWKGAVNFELDLYRKYTDGILTTPPIQLVLGTATAPTQNTAAVLNKGIELTLGWRGKAGDFNFGLTGNFAYNYNRVTKYKGKFVEGYNEVNGVKTYSSNIGDVSSGSDTRVLEGHTISELYVQTVYKGDGTYTNPDGTINVNGGPKDGMIRTTDDMNWLQSMIAAGYTFQPAGGVGKAKIYYGDLVYADNNGDGVYGNTYDKKFLGKNSTPRYNFGMRGDLSWKGIDISMLWSGSTGFQYLWNVAGYNNSTVQNGYSIPLSVANDHYYYNDADPSDPDNNITGKAPRLKNTTDAQNAAVSSNYWIYNAGYIKLKNLQIGYMLPQRIVKKVALDRARIYVSGENLLLITKYPGMDPEIGASVAYPTMRQFSLGLNLTF